MATILIIDEEESIRVLLRSALEAAGYEITEDANGRQGLELYRHRQTGYRGHCMPERMAWTCSWSWRVNSLRPR